MMFETREQIKTHAPPVFHKRNDIEYMAYTGQYEFVYSFIKKLDKESRESYFDKNILSQAIWGSIMKVRMLQQIHNDDGLQNEKKFLIELVDFFLQKCKEHKQFPRELFESLLYVSELLVQLTEYELARKYLEDALAYGINKFPSMRMQAINRIALIMSNSGNLEASQKFLSDLVEHPYLISDRNKIAELLFNYSQVKLKNRHIEYYKKILFLGLRYFYSNIEERRRFYDQLILTYRRSYKLLISSDVNITDKMLFMIHWVYFKLLQFKRLSFGTIVKPANKILLGLIYLINYGKRAETIQLKREIVESDYPILTRITNDNILSPQTDNLKNILITRAMGGIGDLLMMTSGIHALKKKYPNKEIHLAVQKRYFQLFEGNDDVKLVDIEGEFFSHLEYKRWYNLTDCPASRVESRTAPKVRKSRIDIFARSLGIRGIKYFTMHRKPRYFITEDEKIFANNFWNVNDLRSKKVIGVQIHSDETYRDYPLMEKLVERISKEYTVLLFDGTPINGYNFENVIKVESFSLRKAFAIASRCDLIIAPDSAFVHFAAAFDIPTIALFGPIDGKVRTKHYPNCTFIDSREQFGCLPCWRNESIPCKLTGMRISVCMEHISIDNIINTLHQKLNGEIQ